MSRRFCEEKKDKSDPPLAAALSAGLPWSHTIDSTSLVVLAAA
jgi:hypothetical protein